MNRSKKKWIAAATVPVLALCVLTGTAMAYLDARTEPVVNTFMGSSLDIELTEPLWDPEESHNVERGASFDKNPTVTVKSGSEPAYVFAEVTIEPALKNILEEKTETAGGVSLYCYPAVNPNWVLMSGFSTEGTFVYKYAEAVPVSPEESVVLPTLFDKIAIREDATDDELDAVSSLDISVVSHAVQTQGFATPEEAYAAAYGTGA